MSCVEGVSVSDERRLLAEIRRLGIANISRTTRLSNGMLVEEFAMLYVIGNRRKRQHNMQKSKEKSLRKKLAGSDDLKELEELEELEALGNE